MGKIFINRAGTSLGTFEPQEVQEGLASGRFLTSDLAWQEGMPEWKALGDWQEFTAASGPVLPEATLAADSPEAIDTRPPVPSWENRKNISPMVAIVESIKQILLDPSDTFTRMPKTGGIGGPFIFYFVLTLTGAFAAHIYESVFSLSSMFADESMDASATAMGTGLGLVTGLIIIPPILAIVIFITSGVTHLVLMLLSGANQPYETTFRVIAYATGAVGLFSVIPVCGGFVGGIWGIVIAIIGLYKAHKTELWKAIVAELALFIICCGIGILVFVTFGAAAFAAASAAGTP